MLSFLFLMLIQKIAWTAEAQEQIVLTVGERRILPARGELLLGSSKVLGAKDLGHAFQIEGLKSGWTEIQIGKTPYQVSVLQQKQIRTSKILHEKTKRSLGLKSSIKQGEVMLEGKLLTLSEWTNIASICAAERCDFKSRFETTPRLRKQIQDHFSSRLQAIGYGVFRLIWEPDIRLLLPEKQKGLDEIQNLLSSYGISIERDPQALELAPSIRVQIMILEIKKDESRKYGFKWPTEYSAKLLPKAVMNGDMLMSAHFYESRGLGKILANPSLLCRSGKESEFLAGGEIPIKLMNFKMQDVIWKKYGILLKLKPQADFSGRMSLGIETEISTVDGSISVDGIPAFHTNRVQSHFDLSEPRTIALSGLIKSQSRDVTEGLLGLSRVPILGSLFSSRDFQEDRTELVILVKPEIVMAHEQEGAE